MKKFLLIAIALIAAFLVIRSTRKEPAAPTVSQAAPGTPKAIPQKEAISGSTLNKVFPPEQGEYKVTFTQEKDGFAQADLSKDGVKLSALTVSDTDANPSAREKFKSSTRKVGGYPAAAVGSQGTAILVGDRYQVQARSLTPAFTASDRDAWLEKFRLDSLESLAGVKK